MPEDHPAGDALDGAHHPDHAIEEELAEVASETWQSLIGRNGYLSILLLLIGVMLAGPMLGRWEAGAFVSIVFTGGTLLLTVYRSTSRPRIRQVATALTVVAVAGGCVTAYIHYRRKTETAQELVVNHSWEIVFSSIYLVLLLVCLPLVLIKAFGHRRVSLNTVCATISGYLLIGLIFAASYRIVGGVSPPFFNQPIDADLSDYSYFSFITLTTVGYGDLTARADGAHGLVMLEAVAGQIFMVTAVARVVSMLGSRRD